MPWFQFDKDFVHRPKPQVAMDYKKGLHLNIPEPAAKAAEEAGAGYRTAHVSKPGDAKDGTQKVREEKNDG